MRLSSHGSEYRSSHGGASSSSTGLCLGLLIAPTVAQAQLLGPLSEEEEVAVGRTMVNDEHPVLYIEPKGHGIEAFHGEDQLEDATEVVVYRHTGEAAEPSGLSGSGAAKEVGYDLSLDGRDPLAVCTRAVRGGCATTAAGPLRCWTLTTALLRAR